MSSEPSEQSAQALQQELLERLTLGDGGYPWNPSDPEADGYFEGLESQDSLSEVWTESELATRASQFFAIAQAQFIADPLDVVKSNLHRRFSDFVPAQQLAEILERAGAIADRNLPRIGQLIACVQPLWSTWSEEDLQVFARPLAMAMRGSDSVKQAPWDELTEIERIRLTLAVARAALNQLAVNRK